MVEGTVGPSWLPALCLRELAAVLLAVVGGLLYMGASANALLPDGRAWELVSPTDKNGGDIAGIEGDNGGGVAQASADGQAITYVSLGSFENPKAAPIGSQYLAVRDPKAGWQTKNISTKTNSQTYVFGGGGIPYRAFSPDLARGLVFGGARGGAGAQLPVESPPLVGTNAPAGYEDFYLNEFAGAHLESILSHPPSASPEEFGLRFLGSTPNLEDIIFQSPNVLAEGSENNALGTNLYRWERATGQFLAVNVLPNGLPEVQHLVKFGGNHTPSYGQALSDDGSRVVWTAESAPSALYVRERLGTEHPLTVQADEPAGEGEFLTASSDDKKIYFADRHKLTATSTDGGGTGLGDLYRFEPEGAIGSRLVDLTPDSAEAGGAEVQGVLGASEDGSYLYFMANGVLAENDGLNSKKAERGDCRRGGESSPEETCNLYVWHEGEGIKFIAPLSGADESESIANFNELGVGFDWARNPSIRTTRVSVDGTRLVFMSERSLTGYDNTVDVGTSCGKVGGVQLSAQCEEVFVYSAKSGHIICVSCNAADVRPVGPSSIPGATEFSQRLGQYQAHVLSEGVAGDRVFFDSADALAPQDSNHAEDVYENENGRSYLLSGGTSSSGASLLDASTNGSDVFFTTRAQLTTVDTDQSVDLYDARAPHSAGEAVGFANPSAPVVCEGEGCRPTESPAPTDSSLSSMLFQGLGNIPTAIPRVPAKPKSKKAKAKSKTAKKKTRRRGRAAVRRAASTKGGMRS